MVKVAFLCTYEFYVFETDFRTLKTSQIPSLTGKVGNKSGKWKVIHDIIIYWGTPLIQKHTVTT